MRRLLLVALAAATFFPALAQEEIKPEARALFDRAEVAREEGRLEEAVPLYRQAIETQPLYLEAHAGHLAALRGTGNLATANEFYAKLVAEYPDSVDLKAFRACCLPDKEALALLEPLASDFPGNLRAGLELGRIQMRSGDLRHAERTLKDVIRQHGTDPRPRLLLGDVYLADGKESRARKEYEEARELDNTFVPAILRWALCRHREGKSEDALEALGRLVAEDNLPRLVAGWWLLAVIRMELGKYDDALASIDAVLAVDKDDHAALLTRGQILLLQNKPVEAAAAFQKAAEVRPDSSEALFSLGWAHEKSADAPEIQDAQRKERLAKAAEAYEQCAGLDPGPRPRDSLGFVYLLGERHEDALTQFKRARDINPQFAAAMNNLGLSLDIADMRAEAKKRYETVLSRIDRENVRAHVMLALDLWLDGSGSKAIRELEKALKIDPQDDLAWTFLGDIYWDAKKADRAIRAYKQAVEINDGNFTAWYHMGLVYDDEKQRYEEAEHAYEKAFQARPDPPVDLLLRLGGINDTDILDRPEKALQYYQAYVDAGGTEEWVLARIDELKELLGK